jgi:predicted enzyme related to lactoylglutathione lyase
MRKVVHFEIPADDVARAQKFYSTVFGWKMNSMPEMQYTLVSTVPTDEKGMPTEAGAINGGMLKREDPVMTPVITIDVENIDKALETIEKNGGRVVRKSMPVADMGFAAYFKDSEGNMVGLWQSKER